MMKSILHIVFCFILGLSSGISQQEMPQQYIVYHTNNPISIDGFEDEVWRKTPWTSDFVDIEGYSKPLPEQRTRVKMLWDSEYLYVYAYLDEPHIWAKLHKRDTVVFFDDDFEIFIDPDGDSHNYTEIEVNALNTVWDLMLLYPYRVDQLSKVLWNWDIRGLKTAVRIDGTLNQPSDIDKGWAVEVAIPLKTLHEFAGENKAQDGAIWRINFSRVDWQMIHSDGYSKKKNGEGKSLPERNWVWSPQGAIAMHMPENWGYIMFDKEQPNKNITSWEWKKDDFLQKALWKQYHEVIVYGKKNNSYRGAELVFDQESKSCSKEWSIETTKHQFSIIARSCEEENYAWIINELGKIRRINAELDR